MSEWYLNGPVEFEAWGINSLVNQPSPWLQGKPTGNKKKSREFKYYFENNAERHSHVTYALYNTALSSKAVIHSFKLDIIIEERGNSQSFTRSECSVAEMSTSLFDCTTTEPLLSVTPYYCRTWSSSRRSLYAHGALSFTLKCLKTSHNTR